MRRLFLRQRRISRGGVAYELAGDGVGSLLSAQAVQASVALFLILLPRELKFVRPVSSANGRNDA